MTHQGAGLVDVGAATAGEVAASPSTLALGRSTGAGWRVKASFTVTNLSTRTLHLALGVRTQDEGAAAVDFQLSPTRITLRQGKSVLVRLSAITASAPSGSATADGSVLVAVQGGGGIRVPWAIAFGGDDVDLIGSATLSAKSFGHSDTKPALLALDAGRVLEVDGRPEIRPVRQLDVVLRRADGTHGRAARAAPRRAPRPLSPSASPDGARTGSSCRPGTTSCGSSPIPSSRARRAVRRLPFTLR